MTLMDHASFEFWSISTYDPEQEHVSIICRKLIYRQSDSDEERKVVNDFLDWKFYAPWFVVSVDGEKEKPKTLGFEVVWKTKRKRPYNAILRLDLVLVNGDGGAGRKLVLST